MTKLWFALLFFVSGSALALNLQSFRFSDAYRYSLLDDSYQEKFRGQYVMTAGLGYTNSPFYVSDPGVTQLKNEIINYQYLLAVGASYYYSRELVLGIDLNASHSEVFNETKTSLADTILRARWNLYRENKLSFALVPKLFLPTGQTDNFTTINSPGGSLLGVMEYKFQTWHFLGSLGYFYGGNNHFAIVDYRNLILLNLGVSYDLNHNWALNAEGVKTFTTNRDYRQDEGDYYLTTKYKVNQLIGLFFGAGIAGLDEIDRNNYTVFTGLKIHQ